MSFREKTMSGKEKHLCKWDTDRIETRIDRLMKIVKDASFVCRRCGRAAKDRKWLCRPVALK
jgi:hypothetical protein